MSAEVAGKGRSSRPDYAAIWRWHFYAGLSCLPFVCRLALTGSIYLFRPDIDAVPDRPYENLELSTGRALPSREVVAATSAVPGSKFSRYEPPATATGAAQVVVSQGDTLTRVYVDPATLKPMKMRYTGGLVAAILVLAVIIPLFGLSLLAVLAVEAIFLRRIPMASQRLGLRPAASAK